jgi:transglutaminase-like putative cysteine protease
LRFFLLPIAMLTASIVSGHAEAPYLPPMTVLKQDISYRVNADGTCTKRVSFAGRFETSKSLDDLGTSDFFYSSDLESIKVLDAYTITPDGKRIDVSPDKIADEENPLSTDAPEFSDEHVVVIAFPALAVGAVKHYDYVETVKKPFFPGVFMSVDQFKRSLAYDEVSVTLIAPAAMPLQTETRLMTGGKEKNAAIGEQSWHWKTQNITGLVPEEDAIDVADVSPLVAVTSFKTVADAGAAYRDSAAPTYAVTPAVQKLADQVTANITDPHAQAVALYQWVSRNVRYVAFEIGRGGVVPHDADAIIAAGYGDCKDHVTLLQALLAAKGIGSEGVLVDARSSYWAPTIPISVGPFDHIITYLPAFKTYVDSTAEFAPFGVLPPEEAGKPALAVGTGGTTARMIVLPLTSPLRDRELIKTDVTIGADGTISGASTVSAAGVNEYEHRALLAEFPNGQQAEIASKLLAMFGQQGSGNFIYGEPRDLAKPFSYKTTFTLPQAVNLPGPGSLTVPIGIPSFTGIAALPMEISAEQPSRAVLCGASDNDERTSIQLASGMSVKFLPSGTHYKNALGSYASTYAQQGDTVSVQRRLIVDPGAATCSIQQYQMYQQLAAAVGHDLRSTIIY